LARLISYEFPEEAYLAGLLHKLGQLILLDNLADEYVELLEKSGDPLALADAEREAYGITHAELGAWLIDQWQADDFIGDAVRFQDEPTEMVLDAHPLVQLLHLASKFDNLKPYDPEVAYRTADTLFGLAQPVIDDFIKEVDEEVEKAAKALNLAIDPSEAIPPAPLKGGGAEQALQIDKERLELARMVRNMALLDGTSQTLRQAQGVEETLLAIQHNVNILFGIGGALFFLINEEKNALCGETLPGQNRQLDRLCVPLEKGRSIISEALLDRSIECTLSAKEKPLSVIDRQLIRLTAKEGLLVVPLIGESRPLGVMILGVQRATYALFTVQNSLLEVFSREAASYLEQSIQVAEAQEESRAEEQSEFTLRARKVVHEANNPLGIVNNYLHILGSKLGDDHPASKDLQIVKEEIERVGRILLRLPDEFQQQASSPGKKGAVDLEQLIRGVVTLFERSLFATHGIHADLDLERDVPPIITHRDRLKQVLINLVKNAVEALPKGGRIQISMRDNVNVNGEPFVEITVADNGPGMPRDIIENIFTPVTSTKGGGHSGLGLTIARNLVNEMGGSISCRTGRDGTRFQILLPRITAQQTSER
ncbi:MAG TPA: HDOD domain-containing protein, partial [Chromatiales bacterium]|nr:HDOD domain-containing protein [Chromatiales bacterium]